MKKNLLLAALMGLSIAFVFTRPADKLEVYSSRPADGPRGLLPGVAYGEHVPVGPYAR